jgi:HlyD family secretion protein
MKCDAPVTTRVHTKDQLTRDAAAREPSGADRVIARKRRVWPYLVGAAGVLAAIVTTVAASRLAEAAPAVERSSVFIGTVKRGEFVREVAGTGRLVSHSVRVVAARAAGTVDQILVKPGETVARDTVLLVINNPDLEFQALEAATAVKEARAALLDLRASLEIQKVQQQSVVENVRAQQRDADRRATANEPLAQRKIVATLEAENERGRAQELAARVRFEEKHVEILEGATAARIRAQNAKIDGLLAQAVLRAQQVEGLRVRAFEAGILKELPLEVGQQVRVGDLLAKVVNADQLKAEVRIPEDRARSVRVGLPVRLVLQGETVMGRVTRVDPAVQDGFVKVDVSVDGKLPDGARLDLSAEASIEVERNAGVLFVGKPAFAGGNSTAQLYKLEADGRTATRSSVTLGESSVNDVRVLQGLHEGDRIILSDTSEHDNGQRRIELK